MAKHIDLTGQQFGDLRVISRSDRRDKYHNPLWECLCTCGKTVYVPTGSLNAGYYKSCGCKRIAKRDKGVLKHIAADRVDGTRKTALKAKIYANNKSGIKGVRWNEQRQKWTAHIGFKGKQITLGYFINKDDAIAARKAAEEKYHKPILEGENE
ncbi:AP2 domain protein [compost metagenome]